jgi:hypothetical protein
MTPPDPLTALADLRMTGAHTPTADVLRRGRALRRRRRAGGTVVATAVVTTAALAAPGSPFALGGPERAVAPAATPTSPDATSPAPVPCGDPRPPVEDLLYLPPESVAREPVVLADVGVADGPCARRRAVGGLDVGAAGTVRRSYQLWGPSAPADLVNQRIVVEHEGEQETVTVRGTTGRAIRYHDIAQVTWGSGDATRVFEATGMTVAEAIAAVNDLRIGSDGAVDRSSLPAGFDVVDTFSGEGLLGGGWSASFGNVIEDDGGWTLHVDDGRTDPPPALVGRKGDRVTTVAGRTVVSGGFLTRAVWQAADGRLVTVTGDISQERAREVVANLEKVGRDDPRVVAGLAATAEQERASAATAS